MSDADEADRPDPTRPGPAPGVLLEQAWAHHAAACVLYARQLVGAHDTAAAEDAAQEAFVRLMAHLARCGHPPEHVRAWLLSATRSAAIDGLRGESRRRRRERAAAPAGEAFVSRDEDHLDAAVVAEALASLPARQREVVTLRIWGELGFAEIAELLGMAASTAHAAYSEGLAALRTRIRVDHAMRQRKATVD